MSPAAVGSLLSRAGLVAHATGVEGFRCRALGPELVTVSWLYASPAREKAARAAGRAALEAAGYRVVWGRGGVDRVSTEERRDADALR